MLSTFAIAQEDLPLNHQFWLDFWPHGRVNDQLEFYGDLSVRISDRRLKQRFVIRPAAKYQLTPRLSIHVGYGLFYTRQSESFNSTESRPWLGLRLGIPDIGRLKFKHYFRYEHRTFFFEESSLTENFHRGRYMISTNLPLNGKSIQEDVFFIPLGFEWLATGDEDVETVFASEWRLVVGIGHAFNDNWILRFDYMNWWSRLDPGDPFVRSDQVFRLRIHYQGWMQGE